MPASTSQIERKKRVAIVGTLLIVVCGIGLYFTFDLLSPQILNTGISWRTVSHFLFVALDLCIMVLLIGALWTDYLLHKKEKEQLAQQSDYVATAAHELRTPLTSIRWSLSDLRNDSTLSSDTRTAVNVVYDRVRGLIELTNTFMLMASVDHDMRAQDLKLINITPIILEVLTRAQFVAVARQITIQKDPSIDASIQVRGDPLRLRLVFDNLLSNAIKYSRENTTISVGFIDQASTRTFFVRDQGIGIPKETIAHVFTGFQRARNAKRPGILGTGFGLYMVKKIVDFHRGTITCESEINKGTTFYVSLPGF